MPRRRTTPIALVVVAMVFAGCGGDDERGSETSTSPRGRQAQTLTTAAAAKLPPLARTAVDEGELLFSGEASPSSQGSFALDGTYVARFEQFAPENPKQDFSDQTAFTAYLRPAGSSSEGPKLFGAAAASGQRVLTRHGRYVLDIAAGDFPYAVRFTPQR